MTQIESNESQDDVVIRHVTAADAASIAMIYAAYVCETAISFELQPPTPAEMNSRITVVTQQYPWLVCQHGDRVIGYVYATQHAARAAYRWSVDVTVYIDREYPRRGVGRALYTSLFELLRLQGYRNAFAGVTLPNAGSIGLHEAMGFVQIATYRKTGYKLGRWHDVGWWQLILREHDPSPAEPRPIGDFSDDPLREAALRSGTRFLKL